jgi:hypothetical protein
MGVALKTKIVLAIMGIAMGVLAGLLVGTFDFTPYMIALLIILAMVVIIDILLLYVAHRKGKLSMIGLGE